MKPSPFCCRIFADVKSAFALVAVLLCSCSIPSAPSYFEQSSRSGFVNLSNLNVLPIATYDAVFFSMFEIEDYPDSTSTKTLTSNSSSIFFYNDLGDIIHTFPPQLQITLNDSLLGHRTGSSQDLHFPDSVHWSLTGDGHFAAVTHALCGVAPIDIHSPATSDTQDRSKPFTINFTAPGADRIAIERFYFGRGQYRDDNSDTLTDVFERTQTIIPSNIIEYTVPAFSMDSNTYRSFAPRAVNIRISTARGDTVHARDSIYGFITQSSHVRQFRFKQ